MTTPMIPRLLGAPVADHLRIFPVVALLGPRQVGKTTLARALVDATGDASGGRPGLYLDLEDPTHRARLSDPASYFRATADRLVVLDEVHRVPELFRVLRGVVDERIRAGAPTGHFLVLGSASMELMRQSGESLAGRIGYLELDPLDVREIAPAGGPSPDMLTRLWLRGGLPPSFLAPSDEASAVWRSQFIRTYLERDIPMLGPRIAAETLRRFWMMLAHSQGGPWNAAKLARSLGVDGKTVMRYLDLLVDLLLVRRLPPLHANVRKRLVKAPKTYIRDSGLVHALLRLDEMDAVLGHPVAGGSWEGFVIETLIRAAPDRTQASHYRTATGVEIDLVLDLPGGQVWAVEIKRGSAATPTKGLATALNDVQPDAAFVVHGGEERYPLGDGVDATGVWQLATELAAQGR